MPGFRTERPAARGAMISLRLTPEQNDLLIQIADRMGNSKSEVLRIALDFWLEKSPEAIAAAAPAKKRR